MSLADPELNREQWRIQDFPQGGAPTPKSAIIFQIFAENCMKMKEFGPPGGGRVPGAPRLDPPMENPKLTAEKRKRKENSCRRNAPKRSVHTKRLCLKRCVDRQT